MRITRPTLTAETSDHAYGLPFIFCTNAKTGKQYLRTRPVPNVVKKRETISEDIVRIPTIEMLKTSTLTKGELAAHMYYEMEYDCALPYQWLTAKALNSIQYDVLIGGVIWLYVDGDRYGKPAALTVEAKRLLDLMTK